MSWAVPKHSAEAELDIGRGTGAACADRRGAAAGTRSGNASRDGQRAAAADEQSLRHERSEKDHTPNAPRAADLRHEREARATDRPKLKRLVTQVA